MTGKYTVERRNKVRQIPEKAHYDRATVHRVIDAGVIAHVAFIEDELPVVVPMLYGRDGETIYVHGARKARVIRMLEQNDQVALNITLVDALVLARSAFNSSMNYRSATVYGRPGLIDDWQQKLHAMRVISEHTMPGRWDELRAPLEREVKMTGIIAIEIDLASAKISAKSVPEDEEEDYATPVWAGILPMQCAYTTLVNGDRLVDGVEPSAAVKALEGKVF